MADLDKKPRSDLRQTITDRILEQLGQGNIPWRKPWDVDSLPLQTPFNPITGRPYRGGNALWLMLQDHADPRWCTLKQANEQGWQVRKGEKSSMIEYWKWADVHERPDPVTGEITKVEVKLDQPRVFYARIFNAAQIEGIPPLERVAPSFEPHEYGERLMAASGIPVIHDQRDQAFYSPGTDRVHLPPKEAFQSVGAYYGTAMHELAHGTGHPSRLNRELGAKFGDELYAREELRAELASVFIMAETGIPNDLLNHASYIESWIGALQKDKHEIFRAARDAEDISDYLLERVWERELEQSLQLPEVTDKAAKIGEARHDWRVFSTAIADGVLMLECQITGAQGIVRNPTKEEWNEAYHAPSHPYRWRGGVDRVEIMREGHQRLDAQEKPLDKAVAKETANKIYLAVPYDDRKVASGLGARWDKEVKAWYITDALDAEKFSQWKPPANIRDNAISQFKGACADWGLDMSGDIVADGQLHYVALSKDIGIHGKALQKRGAYALNFDGKRPNGYIHNFDDAEGKGWAFKGVILSPADMQHHQEQAVTEKQKREAEIQAIRDSVAAHSTEVWGVLPDVGAVSHGYLNKKGVAAHGLKIGWQVISKDGENWKVDLMAPTIGENGKLLPPYGIDRDAIKKLVLVVPMRDENFNIRSLQSINGNGDKRFEAGGGKSGLFHIIGANSIEELRAAPAVAFTEGYATGASIYEANGMPVVITFDSGNLPKVAEIVSTHLPPDTIRLICGDDDRFTKCSFQYIDGKVRRGVETKNAGRESAIDAVEKTSGVAVFPSFPPGDYKSTDFNDMAATMGTDAVREKLDRFIGYALVRIVERGDSRGKIVADLGDRVIQDTGLKNLVAHAKDRLEGDFDMGRPVVISYRDGKGSVADRGRVDTPQIERLPSR